MNPVDELIEAALNSDEEYIPAIKGADIVAAVRERDPQILLDWLNDRAESVVTDQLRIRRHVRKDSARRGAFADQAEKFEAGESSAEDFRSWFDDVTFRVDDKDTQKKVRFMTGDDHYFVADFYKRHAVKAELLAAFHVVIAKKVKKRTTGEVMTETEYAALYAQYTKTSAA